MQRERASTGLNTDDWDELIACVRSNIGAGECLVTGLGVGGLYASNAAAQLNLMGIVFGAPTTEKLVGDVKNYISENEPVGPYVENVVFVRHQPLEEDVKDSYLETFLFDKQDNIIIGEQTEYSKFCSWFYNTASKINNHIWSLFFTDTDARDTLLDKDLYCVFLKIKDLRAEVLEVSLRKAGQHLETEHSFDVQKLMRDFSMKVDSILETENLRIDKTLTDHMQNLIDSLLDLSGFSKKMEVMEEL